MRHFQMVLVVVVAVIVGVEAYGCWQREIGRRDATTEVRDKAIDSLEARGARLDTVYLRDTVRLTRTRTITDSVLVHHTDTLLHVDTVRVLIAEERAACDAVIATCEARVAVQKARGDSLDIQLEAERGRDRILGVKLPSRTVMFFLGAAVGAVAR